MDEGRRLISAHYRSVEEKNGNVSQVEKQTASNEVPISVKEGNHRDLDVQIEIIVVFTILMVVGNHICIAFYLRHNWIEENRIGFTVCVKSAYITGTIVLTVVRCLTNLRLDFVQRMAVTIKSRIIEVVQDGETKTVVVEKAYSRNPKGKRGVNRFRIIEVLHEVHNLLSRIDDKLIDVEGICICIRGLLIS